VYSVFFQYLGLFVYILLHYYLLHIWIIRLFKIYFFLKLIFLLILFVGKLEAESFDLKKFERLEERLQKLERKEKERHKKGESDIRVYFKNGFKMRSLDNNFKFQVGGRIMHDWGFFSENQKYITSHGIQENGARFRRVRFFMAGMLYKSIKFKWDIDVDGGSNGVIFKDMFIGMTHIPILGDFRVGHFKRPASLDSVTSSKYLTFLERSLTNTFFKTRNTGFAFFNQHFDKRLTWFTFLNKETSENPPDFKIDGDWNITTRISGLPYMSEDAKRWTHIGASWSYEKATDDQVTFAAARDSEIVSTILTTGALNARKFNIVGLESAVNWNQFGLQGEYVFTYVDKGIGITGCLDSFYIQGSWYLTGEHRHYSKINGAIGRFKPNQNFSWNKNWSEGHGTGALQLALRYSDLDLNDTSAGIEGGEQQSFTVGLNWEFNPVSRLMYNYVRAYFYDETGTNSGILDSNVIRFQVDF
jgi:phosphate-selective porin OprO and OprP